MFNGFVTSYKDNEDFVHLYFFRGIDDDYKSIYNNLDLSECGSEYDEIKYNADASDFRFLSKNITKITCKLVKSNGQIDYYQLIV